MATSPIKNIHCIVSLCLLITTLGCSSVRVINTRTQDIPLKNVDRVERDTIFVLHPLPTKIHVDSVVSVTDQRKSKVLAGSVVGLTLGIVMTKGELTKQTHGMMAGTWPHLANIAKVTGMTAIGVVIGIVLGLDSKHEMAGWSKEKKRKTLQIWVEEKREKTRPEQEDG